MIVDSTPRCKTNVTQKFYFDTRFTILELKKTFLDEYLNKIKKQTFLVNINIKPSLI